MVTPGHIRPKTLMFEFRRDLDASNPDFRLDHVSLGPASELLALHPRAIAE